MVKFACRIFGHKFVKGTVTLALNLEPGDGEWRKITHSGETLICSRCGRMFLTPHVQIGTENSGIQYGEPYSIDNLRIFTGDVDFIGELIVAQRGQKRPPAPDFPVGDIGPLGTRTVTDPDAYKHGN